MTFSTDLVCKINTPEMSSECIQNCTFTSGAVFYVLLRERGHRLSLSVCAQVLHTHTHTHTPPHGIFSLESKSKAVYIVFETLMIDILTIRIRKGAA